MALDTSGEGMNTKCERPHRARLRDEGPNRNSFHCIFGPHAELFTRLCLVTLAVVAVSGCGTYKEELESAKQQIQLLTQETQSLKNNFARLEEEKNKLNEEMKILTEKDKVLRDQVAALEKAKASLAGELDTANKKMEATQREFESLKKQKKDLESEVEKLKKTPPPPPPLPKESERPSTGAPAISTPPQSVSSPQQTMSPCDALIQYMKKCQAIIRQFKAEERTQKLTQVKQEFAPRMQGAPEKALKAAENWVEEVIRVWDDPREDSAFIILSNKDVVLKSCNKTPEEAGF